MNRYRGFKSIEEQISVLVKPILKKKKKNFTIITNLTKNWQNIVGDKYYQFCEIEDVKSNSTKKNSATLTIKAYNSSIAFFLEANSAQIIENIATYYGYKIIDKITIKQEMRNIDLKNNSLTKIIIDDEQQKFIKKTTSKIKNEDLESVLNRLGEAILGDKSKKDS